MTDDTASPQLFWAEDGSPRSGRFGDVYFSKDDGLAETRAVFLGGCDMPNVWRDRQQFTVAELGFGTGLNIIALIDMWRAHRPADGQLNVFSVEGFPLSRDEAQRALEAWPELHETAQALLAQWPTSRPGFHRIDMPQWGVTIDLAVGEVEWALSEWQGLADAWFLDGFSPALNPGMWSEQIMARVAALSAPGAHLATFTVAGAVRRALAANGYTVDKRPGHGRKRDRLEGRYQGHTLSSPLPRVAVIGAGIAGASAVRGLKAQGVTPVVIEAQHAGSGASGFPAALVTPRLDAGDAFIAGFYAQALERAGQLYASVDNAIVARGVVQLEQAPRDSNRYDKIAVQDLWPDNSMARLDAQQASSALGESVDQGALHMHGAFALAPAPVLQDWLADAELKIATVAAIEKQADGWRIADADGNLITHADHVIITAGWGSAALAPTLPMSPVAGQADWVQSPSGPNEPPVAWGGYSVPTKDGLLYGATHVRGEQHPLADDAASQHNRDTLEKRLPQRASRHLNSAPLRRTAVRATTPQRLPYCGSMDDGLHVLTGMGSRGFCASPLLAEDLVARLLKRPSPLPRSWSVRLSPPDTEQI